MDLPKGIFEQFGIVEIPKIENPIPNIGWLFYKHYYQNVDFLDIKKQDNDKDKNFWKAKNQEITQQKQSSKKYDFIPPKDNSFSLKTTYPGLTLGTGTLHSIGSKGEIKIGFFFDFTTGLPTIPGSTVKGLIRSAFPQFLGKGKDIRIDLPENFNPDPLQRAKAFYIYTLWKNPNRDFEIDPLQQDELDDKGDNIWKIVHKLELALFEGVNVLATFNHPARLVQYLSIYKRDIFHDAVILNPNNKKEILKEDAITPHDGKLRNPTPLAFIKIAPEIDICFQFDLKSPSETNDIFLITPAEKLELFKKILKHNGIGAKTNVGYGQFQ